MADLNKVFLMGRLTFDPELRHTPSGTAVTDLRLATSRIWTGKDGERKEETLFIDVTVWDRQAENCCQYLKKGSSIHVEGSLKMDTWDDKTTGEKRSKIKVQADRVQFLDRRPRRRSAGWRRRRLHAPPARRRPAGARRPPRDAARPTARPEATPPPAAPTPPAAPRPSPTAEDDDIPF